MRMQIWKLALLTGLVLLALLLALTVAAQGPKAPDGLMPPFLHEDEGGLPLAPPTAPDDGETRRPHAPAVDLGQPGLSFRYVQTLGVTEEPYISTTTHLNYPYGIGAEGNFIWIGELWGRRALKYNADGGNLAVIGRAGMGNNPGFVIWSVYDVAADGNGNVWVVDGDAHHVLQFDGNGDLVKELGQAWSEGSTNDRFGQPNSIAFDSQGNIYVSDGGDWWGGDSGNQRIQIFDGDGNYKATLGATGVIGQGNEQFHGPAHIAIYDDRLYVADRGNHRVQIYQITFSPFAVTYVATLGQTGTAGSDNDHFNNPCGVAIDASYIYVADTSNHRVQVFDRASRVYVATIGSYGSGNGEFDNPYDVAVDDLGNLYVADFDNSRVQQFRHAGGTTWNWWLTYGVTGVPYVTDDAHFYEPQGVAVAADGSIYIAENMGRRLVKLAADGTPQWSAPDIPGVLGYSPNDIAIGQDGRVYLAAGWENRIRIYNTDGTLYSAFGGRGDGDYQFREPEGIGVAPNGDIYIADSENQRVQVYAPDWSYKATMGVSGQAGSDNDHLNNPCDVAVDSRGTIYVADEGNDRVQVFDSNRQYVRTIGGGGTGSDFDGWGPYRLALDGQDRLYVADSGNNRLQVFDESGAYLTTIGGGWGNLTGQMRGPFGVAVGLDGAVYVADKDNHRIQKFAPGVPGWVQVNLNGFGEKDNGYTYALATFQNHLYAGMYNANGAQLWRAGSDWAAVTTNGFGNPYNTGILHLVEFKNQLYASTSNWNGSINQSDGGEIWRSSDGLGWTQVVSQGFGDADNSGIFRLAVFSDTLYAGTYRSQGAEIWRSTSGDAGSWQRVVTDGLGDADNVAVRSFAVLSDTLYAGVSNYADGAGVWRSSDGSTWTQVATGGLGSANRSSTSALAVFQNRLYASTSGGSGACVWRCSACDGSDWEQVVTDGFGNAHSTLASALEVLGDSLYFVVGNWETGLEVWRTADGSSWEQIGFAGLGDSNNTLPGWDNAVAVWNDRLYIGTWNNAHGGEIWKRTVTADFAASPTSGGPGTTVAFTNLSGGDAVTTTWDFGDGSPPLVSGAATVTHTYAAVGTYTVTLTVEDGVEPAVRRRPAYIHIARRVYLPLVVRGYDSRMALYDDFDNVAFDGYYNPVKWQFSGAEEYLAARQQGGAMVITNTPDTPAEKGLDLLLAMPPERTLRQLQRFQARLKLSSDTAGTGAKIQIKSGEENINGHGWWTQCNLSAYDGYPPGFGCDVTMYTGSTYTSEYSVSWSGALSFDTWYTARIEIDPDTAQVCFYLDDQQLGCHLPNDASALKAATDLVPRIGSWNGDAGATGSRYFDDVQITPP